MAYYNKIIIIGNLTADPELKSTQTGTSVTTFTVAVRRRFAKEGDPVTSDFFNVVAWREKAEFVAHSFSKGKGILVEGALQNRSYTDKDGNKRTVTEIVAEQIGFIDKKENTEQTDIRPQEANFTEVSDEDNLPF